jgi:hypothetical protein
MARSIGEVMAEGQKLTLELVDLKRKEIAGTATAEDKTRIVQLDAYLLGLVGEAQAQGVGTAVGTGYGEGGDEDTDEDLGYDEYDDDLSLDLDEDEVDETPEVNDRGLGGIFRGW